MHHDLSSPARQLKTHLLAFVGGRSYNQSQYDRAILSRRQPGSVFKPFVYLTAFEEAAKAGRTDVTPASITNDEQETFEFDDQVWTPENYEHEYDGPITFRRALAHSRNLGTIHVAHTLEERVPKRQLLDAVEIYQRMVKDLWKRE